MSAPFASAYHGRRVLVTGHTGFKGSWLAHWLLRLGAEVGGVALAPTTMPNLFGLLALGGRMRHRLIDIRDHAALGAEIAAFRPSVVFHLAAQPLVRAAYREPKPTFDTNVGGTVNLLEAMRAAGGVHACVVVTTDKCYENREWSQGYREDDALGGHDPYSASKAAAEIAVASWRRSFFAAGGPWLASARAGNVIGGGDWSPERIATDVIAACAVDGAVRLRNPAATRPWQHVLEPLAAYLHLGARLLGADGADFAEAWNVAPGEDDAVSVERLARMMIDAWGAGRVEADDASGHPHEAGLLRLDGGKARERLGWHGAWKVGEAVARTVAWHRAHLAGDDCRRISDEQIDAYVESARCCGLAWTGSTPVVR
jgi:CDP-glucose 4,6-dehydratase